MALTVLADVKEYLGITVADYDAVLGNLITRISDEIERYCDRTFGSTDYSEWIDGSGDSTLRLEHYPIIRIDRLAIGDLQVMQIKCAAAAATQAYVKNDGANVTLQIADGADAGTTALDLTVNTTLTLLKAAIEATAGAWTATITGGHESDLTSELRITGYLECLDSYAGFYIPDDAEHQYRYDSDSGFIYLAGVFPQGIENVYVEYTAGYAAIPGALAQVAIEMVGAAFHRRTRDMSLKSEHLGDYSWAAGDGNGGIESFKNRLTPFKRLWP